MTEKTPDLNRIELALVSAAAKIVEQQELIEAWRSWAAKITGIEDGTDESLRTAVSTSLADARGWAREHAATLEPEAS